jgi:type I restriction enzyme S subunit
MSLSIYTETKADIAAQSSIRLGPSYYGLRVLFKELAGSGYQVAQLGKATKFINSGSYIDEYKTDGVKYIRVGDIKKYCIDESELKFVPPEKAKPITRVKTGDIIFGRTEADFDKLGAFSLISPVNDGAAVSQHVGKFHMVSSFCSPEYAVAFLNSKFGKAQTQLASYGDTRVEFTNSQVSEISIVLFEKDFVSFVEQSVKEIIRLNDEAIASFRKAESVITDELAKVNVKTKQATITKSMLIANGMWTPSSYRPEYIESLNRILDYGKCVSLREACKTFKKGIEIGSGNYRVELETDAASIPFIRTSDIYNHEIDFHPDYFFDQIDDPSIKIPQVDPSTILFSKDGKIGQTAIVSEKMKYIPGSGFCLLKSNGKFFNDNVLFALLANEHVSIPQALMKTVIASTISHLRPQRLAGIMLPVLGKEAQDEIDTFIKIFREDIDKKNALIKGVEEGFNSRFSKIVS